MVTISYLFNIILGWILIYQYLMLRKTNKNKRDEKMIPEKKERSIVSSIPIKVIYDQQKTENTVTELAEVGLNYKEFFFSDLENTQKILKKTKERDKVYVKFETINFQKLLKINV